MQLHIKLFFTVFIPALTESLLSDLVGFLTVKLPVRSLSNIELGVSVLVLDVDVLNDMQ